MTPCVHEPRLLSLALLALVSLAAGCVSSPTTDAGSAPLETLAAFPVSSHSTLSHEGHGPSSRWRARAEESPAQDELPRLEVRAWRIELPSAQAHALAHGMETWIHGFQIERDELERRLGELRGEPGVRIDVLPRFFVQAGGSANVSSIAQQAYLERYEIENGGHALGSFVADPVLAVSTEGTLFELRISPEDDELRGELAFPWVSVTRQGEPRTTRGFLPGMPGALEIQVPVYTKQVLTGTTTVDPRAGLLIGPAPIGAGERAEVLVILTHRIGTRVAAR